MISHCLQSMRQCQEWVSLSNVDIYLVSLFGNNFFYIDKEIHKVNKIYFGFSSSVFFNINQYIMKVIFKPTQIDDLSVSSESTIQEVFQFIIPVHNLRLSMQRKNRYVTVSTF